MEPRQLPRNAPHQLHVHSLPLDQPRQHPIFWEPPHTHGGLDLLARAVERQHPFPPDYIRDAEIQVWAQPPVEPHLGFAIGQAARRRCEVDEPEVHGLANLVGEVAGQHDPRDVGLQQSQIRCSMRERLGVQQVLERSCAGA